MQLIRHPRHIQTQHQGGIVTIGKFDGLHLGHQKAIQTMRATAKIECVPNTLITFEPSPLEYFAKKNAPPRLTSFSEKTRLLEQYGVDNVLCLHFGKALIQQSATCFIQELLVNALKIKHILIGDDFRFGAQRQGDIQLLKKMGYQHGFTTNALPTVTLGQQRISSTCVRNALFNGDLALARQLLDRDYAISGRVIYGQQKGRTIGFPTANISFKQHQPPLSGVFVVTVTGLDGAEKQGVANIGSRPTVHGKKPLLEVHLFDFAQTLYGRRITVHFKKKLRAEKHFPSFEALQKQIQHDAMCARHYFTSPPFK